MLSPATVRYRGAGGELDLTRILVLPRDDDKEGRKGAKGVSKETVIK